MKLTHTKQQITIIKTTVLILSVLAVAPSPGRSSTVSTRDTLYSFQYENVLGTSLEMKFIASSTAQSEAAAKAALGEIDRESRILSSWDPNSEFSSWFRTRNQAVHISPELFDVLNLFDLWRAKTHGALDPSAEIVTRVWQKAAANKRMPTQTEIRTAVANVRRVHWKLNPRAHTATHISDVPLALNSFVKSLIAGRAANAAIQLSGARAAVVNIGGDIVVQGDWTEPVNVADPTADAENASPIAHVLLRDRTIATSGDYRRGVEIGGRHYSHIVDPRTGMPADEIISSTVVAPAPADAGALATALSVLSPAESSRLVASMPGVEYMLLTKSGEKIQTRGWAAMEEQLSPEVAAVQPAARFRPTAAQSGNSAWNSQYELTVTLELALIEGRRVRRPYFAIWIEDENRTPVRTISLWFGKYKYLDELRRWSRAESSRSTAENTNIINSVSSATRPPGKYTFQWDGRDDFGKLVKSGKYTVLIEAARENGTYQLMDQEMEFNNTPHHVQLPGGVEIASASLDYHKIVQ